MNSKNVDLSVLSVREINRLASNDETHESEVDCFLTTCQKQYPKNPEKIYNIVCTILFKRYRNLLLSQMCNEYNIAGEETVNDTIMDVARKILNGKKGKMKTWNYLLAQLRYKMGEELKKIWITPVNMHHENGYKKNATIIINSKEKEINIFKEECPEFFPCCFMRIESNENEIKITGDEGIEEKYDSDIKVRFEGGVELEVDGKKKGKTDGDIKIRVDKEKKKITISVKKKPEDLKPGKKIPPNPEAEIEIEKKMFYDEFISRLINEGYKNESELERENAKKALELSLQYVKPKEVAKILGLSAKKIYCYNSKNNTLVEVKGEKMLMDILEKEKDGKYKGMYELYTNGDLWGLL